MISRPPQFGAKSETDKQTRDDGGDEGDAPAQGVALFPFNYVIHLSLNWKLEQRFSLVQLHDSEKNRAKLRTSVRFRSAKGGPMH